VVACMRCKCNGKPSVRRGRCIIIQDFWVRLAERMRILMGPSRSISEVLELDGRCMISAMIEHFYSRQIEGFFLSDEKIPGESVRKGCVTGIDPVKPAAELTIKDSEGPELG